MSNPSLYSQVVLRSHRRNPIVLTLAVLGLLAALLIAMAATQPAFATTITQDCETATGHSISTTNGITTETFDSQVSDCVWTAPTGVTSITVEAFGAQGGNGYSNLTVGLNGGQTYASAVGVTAGNQYVVEIGGQGGGDSTGAGAGGFATGGTGWSGAGGGGGGTFFWSGTSTSPSSVLVAAGGGGGGHNPFGGDGGGGGGSNNTGGYVTGANAAGPGVADGSDGVAFVSGTGTPSTACPALPTAPTTTCASDNRQSLGGYLIITYIAQQTTTTTLTSSASGTSPDYSSVYGEPFTLTATISPDVSADSGSVEFQYSTDSGASWNDIYNCGAVTTLTGNGTTATATCDVNNANSNLVGFTESATAYEFRAIYSDTATSPGFLGSTSPAINQTIGAADTSVALSSSPNASVYGQPFVITAKVTANTPGTINPTGGDGYVNFSIDGNPADCEENVSGHGPYLGSASNLAVCTIEEYYTLEELHAGNHSITAQFISVSGNFNNSGVSAPLTQVINPASTTTTASAVFINYSTGPAVAITATVTINPPSILQFAQDVGLEAIFRGDVSFFNGATLLCTVPLDESGRAECTANISPATVAPHSLTAIYNYDGLDTDFLSSQSTTDVVPFLGGPVVVSVQTVPAPSGAAWLVKGGGFSGTSSVTVCGVAVPFTVINDYTMLIGIPAVQGPQQCVIIVVAAGGTATSGTVIVVATPVPGAPVNVGPSGPPPVTCNVATLNLSGQWTLIAWPGADTPVGQALAASADGCTNGVTAQISVIWGYDAATQTWQAYFPSASNVPGANDLVTLQRGMGYFVALIDPSQAVAWKVELPGS